MLKRSKIQPARVTAPQQLSYEEYVKMSTKKRIVNRQKEHVFKDRFGDVDQINTKLYYEKTERMLMLSRELTHSHEMCITLILISKRLQCGRHHEICSGHTE